MRVTVVREADAPAGAIRVVGAITSNEGVRRVWFRVPRALAADLCDSGEPWLALMLPFASRTGEPIDLDLPVDPLFLENVRGLSLVWASWYPDLAPPVIRAPAQRAFASAGRRGQFFSAGVDSWFTLLRHAESSAGFPRVGDVDDLIVVHGFDIPIDDDGEFARLAAGATRVASAYGTQVIVVATNLRQEMSGAWRDVWGPRWGPLGHGAALAAVGLLLSPRYAELRIGSTHSFTYAFPWGSHPLTDGLFSTSATVFRHDHAGYTRGEKLERIARCDLALAHLRVCYVEAKSSNCSICAKCHRTLLALDALDVLPKATSFDVAMYSANRRRPFLVETPNDHAHAQAVRDVALRCGRTDIVAIVDESVRRSRQVLAVSKALRKVSWRLWDAAYRRLAADMIGA